MSDVNGFEVWSSYDSGNHRGIQISYKSPYEAGNVLTYDEMKTLESIVESTVKLIILGRNEKKS